MSADLLQQLSAINPERVEDVTADEIADVLSRFEERRAVMDTATRDTRRRHEPSGPRRQRRGWLVAVAAAAVVLLGVGGVAWLARGGGDGTPPADDEVVVTTTELEQETTVTSEAPSEETTTTTATTSPPHTTTTTLPAFELPPPSAAWWSAVPAALETPFVRDILATGDGFVAATASADDWTAMVWVSDDGTSWTSVGTLSPDVAVSEMWLAEAGNTVVVANQQLDDGRQTAVVWSGPDPGSLTPVDTNAFIAGDRVQAVSRGGPGIVAVGENGPTTTVLWASVDGTTWERFSDEAGAFDRSRPLSIAGTEDGFVAAGVTIDAEGGNDAAVWTSRDGSTWTRLMDAAFGGPGNQWMDDVAVGGGGFVAVGASWLEGQGVEGAVWHSPDGVTWSRIRNDGVFTSLPPGLGESNAIIEAVTAAGPGFIAAGTGGIGDGDDYRDAGIVWLSSDGLTWERLPAEALSFSAEYLRDVEAGADRVLIAGQASMATEILLWVPER